MTKHSIILSFLAVVMLAGCAQNQGDKQTYGTIIGAGVGLLVGSQIGGGKGTWIAAAVGGLAGAYAGGEIGRGLDENDRRMSQQTAQLALENNQTGQESSWRNPDTGHSGTSTPTRTYNSNGQDCREFESTVYVEGKSETASGRACRNEDGSWTVVP